MGLPVRLRNPALREGSGIDVLALFDKLERAQEKNRPREEAVPAPRPISQRRSAKNLGLLLHGILAGRKIEKPLISGGALYQVQHGNLPSLRLAPFIVPPVSLAVPSGTPGMPRLLPRAQGREVAVEEIQSRFVKPRKRS